MVGFFEPQKVKGYQLLRLGAHYKPFPKALTVQRRYLGLG